ncbi:hypothetical protein HW555_002959 [Spodoptera exigua]|uniref:Enoyl reductase (ER) domain-containing protein n=1 Tax=Spodoptera exigua TaxID=7107 RepID=A0A835L8Y6_SPOEX|nr:hypothetical protein HW555_002959 [Spodoptera exigua]
MRAVGLYKYLPIDHEDSLLDVEVSLPSVTKTDLLIQVKATAVNPIDAKQRAPKPKVENPPRILGWDGAGVVVSKGEEANLFNIGDEVFFTADISRNGANAEYIAVDQFVVAKKPRNWTFEQAASMPLVTLTALESIFDRLLISEKDKGKSILIINSAGGMGSVATQIVKNLGLKVIGTASRPETQAFTRQFGADIVLNHTQDLIPQLEANGFGAGVDFILINFDPAPYWDTMMRAIKPQGKICLIVDSSALVDLRPLKDKSVTLVSEMMTTRIKYKTDDRFRQHELLKEAAQWMEEGKLKCVLTKTLSPINAANVKAAHKLLESKTLIGKLVLTGF